MAVGVRCYHLLLAILCAAVVNPIGCFGQQKEKKLLFVFGDSLFDPGNNQYLGGNHSGGPSTSYPYGMSLHNHSTGRISDGLVVPDFIALYAKLNLLPPFMKPGAKFTDGANFASGGAGVLDKNNGVMNFNTQLTDFKTVVSSMEQKVGEAEAKKILMKSVFLFSLGGNDYFSYGSNYPNATQVERAQYVNTVIGNLTNGFKEIYDIGLRKLAIQNVGPLGCYPGTRSRYPDLVNGTCVENLQTLAAQHNKALSSALKKLQTQLPGFKYSIFDYFHALAARIENPTRYGFKVGLSACCGSGLYNGGGCGGDRPYNLCSNPSEYVLFDGAHHTQRTNKQLAQLLWNGMPKMTAPYNMKQLFEFA